MFFGLVVFVVLHHFRAHVGLIADYIGYLINIVTSPVVCVVLEGVEFKENIINCA